VVLLRHEVQARSGEVETRDAALASLQAVLSTLEQPSEASPGTMASISLSSRRENRNPRQGVALPFCKKKIGV